MKIFVSLASKALLHRGENVLLTTLSLALSIFLFLSVEQLRHAAEEGFTQTISQTDLIVGARTGPANLVLATVFNRGVFANNIKRSTYDFWNNKSSVEWTIPLALGDGHRGYRVVGTTESFFQHYHYQGSSTLKMDTGHWAIKSMEVVVGAEVARKLKYQVGQKVIIDHGVTHDVGMIHHDNHPFVVVGTLLPTGTIIDQSLFVTLESLAEMHEKGVHEDESHNEDSHDDPNHIEHSGLTAFFLKMKNRIDILSLQREINNYEIEPLSAVIPSVVINDIWHMLSYVENALRILGLCILLVSLISMVSILMATLNERRREMSILRALGASPIQLAGLLIAEATIISMAALVVGILLDFSLIFFLKDWLKENYGLFLESGILSWAEVYYLIGIVMLGSFVGLIPALRVYKTSLKDGLIIK